MTPGRIEKSQSPDLVKGLNASFDILFAILLGKGTTILLNQERSESQPVTIINKRSGKALEVEDSSTNQGARIHQVTRNGAANQRWFVKRMKHTKHSTAPSVTGGQLQRYWPTFLRFGQTAYSVVADHSGLCLDILKGSTDNAPAVQRCAVTGGTSHLWVFVPDREGFCFIVNLYSGQVLDVADSSLNNYAKVHQHPFNGGDSQRWQLLS